MLNHLSVPIQTSATCAQCSVYKDEIQQLQHKLQSNQEYSLPYNSSNERLGSSMVMIQGRNNKLNNNSVNNSSPRAKSTPRGHGYSTNENDSQVLPSTPTSSSSSIKKKSTHNSTSNYGSYDAMEASKNQYARQMLLQYLSCKDMVVKGFIEDALCKLYRYNENELKNVFDRRSFDNHILGTSIVSGSTGNNGSNSSLVSIGSYFGFK